MKRIVLRLKPLQSWHVVYAVVAFLVLIGLVLVMNVSIHIANSIPLSDPLPFFLWLGFWYGLLLALVWGADVVGA
jgi:predicted tellurium resistance membrane protein TerC